MKSLSKPSNSSWCRINLGRVTVALPSTLKCCQVTTVRSTPSSIPRLSQLASQINEALWKSKRYKRAKWVDRATWKAVRLTTCTSRWVRTRRPTRTWRRICSTQTIPASWWCRELLQFHRAPKQCSLIFITTGLGRRAISTSSRLKLSNWSRRRQDRVKVRSKMQWYSLALEILRNRIITLWVMAVLE